MPPWNFRINHLKYEEKKTWHMMWNFLLQKWFKNASALSRLCKCRHCLKIGLVSTYNSRYLHAHTLAKKRSRQKPIGLWFSLWSLDAFLNPCPIVYLQQSRINYPWLDELYTPDLSHLHGNFIHRRVDKSGEHSIYCQLKSAPASTVSGSCYILLFTSRTLDAG